MVEEHISFLYILLMGGFQALTGPDHYIVLISFCLGKGMKGYQAFKVGLVWSLGHNVSTYIYGFGLFFLKHIIEGYFVDISAFLSKLVGVSLILVGLYGIHEISEEREERLKSKDKKKPNVINSYYAIFSTGLIQGFTGVDSLIGLIPSLSIGSVFSVVTYTSLLTLGTTIVMCAFCMLLGRFDQILLKRDPSGELPLTLSTYACYISIAVGLVMTILEFNGYQ